MASGPAGGPALTAGPLTASVSAAPAPAATTPGALAPTATPSPGAEEQQPAPRSTPRKTRKVVPARGPGTYTGSDAKVAPASSRGTLRRFDVRVEKGLDIDPEQAARLMESVLNDDRSWAGTGRWRFRLVPTGKPADLHAYIVTPGTTDELCAPLLTRGKVSCQNGNRVVLNARRWTYGVRHYDGDVASYRRYLVNHEFGHALGRHHLQCPGRGRPAPVMMQQTKGLGGCRKNPWPRGTG